MRRTLIRAIAFATLGVSIAACSTTASTATICSSSLEGQSVARRWNEQLLDAIRRDTPAPTVHARNLYHTSAAMWDAWAAFDPQAIALFTNQQLDIDRSERDVVISFAAHTVLVSRYRNAVGGLESLASFDAELVTQCLSGDAQTSDAAMAGIDIGNAVLDASLDDGSFELDGYLDLSYESVNPPLVVSEEGAYTSDPDRWQPLRLAESITQNEQLQVQPLQFFIGSQWGSVTPFALPASRDGLPVDPGPPPRLDTDRSDAVAQAINVVEYQGRLDEDGARAIDISPATIGNNTLGTNDGRGYEQNPKTGTPYESNRASEADFSRVVAEFWADGPNSETPPGHWNTVANFVSDSPSQEFLVSGLGDPLPRLEWDVKLYVALNGAMHDAAIAAWGAKRHFDSSRPISIIRHLAELGQSSSPELPHFHPDGIPLVEGTIELVTEESASGRHDGLEADTIAIRGWAGHSSLHDDRDEVGWIDATTWVPYQLDTFVTPSFPGYVSGHSAFSRAGAEVLTSFTGSSFFPGGLGEWAIPAGWLRFDEGPSEPVLLQWATYFDAADQAGESRLYGGIHIAADDFEGRRVGDVVGQQAVERAFVLFG